MMWLPAWLGQAYCALYSLEEKFTVGDIAKALNVSTVKAALIASRLTRAGWLERLGRGWYSAVEPEEIIGRIAIWREIDRKLAEVPQREFVPQLRRFMDAVVRKYGRRLISAALFGSLARGRAGPTSDLDVLLVIEGLPKDLAERQEEIVEAVLTSYGRSSPLEPCAPISPVLYTPSEALEFHNIYLDMVHYRIMLLDGGELLGRRLTDLSKKLAKLGSRRLEIRGKPVWILKPDLRRGEVVELG